MTLAQVQKNRSESILIANALFSIPVHTDDQDLSTFAVIHFNTPLMSFHKAMSRKSHSQMEHQPFTYNKERLLLGPGKGTTQPGLDAMLIHM